MNRTILIIDDDIDLVEVIRLTLEAEGFEVIDAQNGARGIELARQKNPDIILLDVMLEDIDEGFQVAYELRKGDDTKDIPILMLSAVSDQTGYSFDRDKDQEFLPVDEFIEKPVSPKALVDLVRKHLPANA
ncbi:MAG: response regulator [Candidatus Eisenbacteria bacterium]|uniref:Response regulator n=1 Tax=Eiseniibacteriota bacterium TaxID=2212470 RepID=A0A948WDQ4_UNCEI|nr:response regulator [Candidatus Eisenbacteria bacterium]MBU1947397.1 response regulator [Candidatus Eisenbacteria bacterium]MBU2692078.1 response regulator [Candidatus Eisenbacteria bacterium]